MLAGASKMSDTMLADYTIVEETSMACSPLQFDNDNNDNDNDPSEMESTRCDQATRRRTTRNKKLVTTLDLNATEEQNSTLEVVAAPVPVKTTRKRKKAVEVAQSNTSSETGEGEGGEAEDNGGKRVTRQTRSSRRK